MSEWQSRSHVRWCCKDHLVFEPKYRKRSLYCTDYCAASRDNWPPPRAFINPPALQAEA